MLKKFTVAAALAVAALLLGGQTARAQFGYYAYLYLSDGYDFAVQAYLDTGDPDAYDAAVYAYYAQYFASVGEYYYAYVYGSYASDFAISAYDETGDPDAYDAYVYLAYGAVYAYYAYLGY